MLLKWTLDLNGNDKKLLEKDGQIQKEALVTITKGGRREKFWPVMKGTENETLNVRTLPSKNQLVIQLTSMYVPTGRGGAFMIMGGNREAELVCESGENMVSEIGKGQIVYAVGTRMRGSRWVESNPTPPLKVSISLDECPYKESEKKTTCPLKVVIRSY